MRNDGELRVEPTAYKTYKILHFPKDGNGKFVQLGEETSKVRAQAVVDYLESIRAYHNMNIIMFLDDCEIVQQNDFRNRQYLDNQIEALENKWEEEFEGKEKSESTLEDILGDTSHPLHERAAELLYDVFEDSYSDWQTIFRHYWRRKK